MDQNQVKKIQQALLDKGYNPGPIDGIWGRNTSGAVEKFQADHGLVVDGIVGPETLAALFGSVVQMSPSGAMLPWFQTAVGLMGTREVVGEGDNQDIIRWAKTLHLDYAGDDVPWCGLFVAHCVGATLPKEPLPGNPLGARQWGHFGDSTEPRLGAVMVFWRESTTCGKGHVGFYAGEDKDAYQILGGNQSNQVSLAWVAKDRFITARWPKTASFLMSSAVVKDRNDGLSTDEA